MIMEFRTTIKTITIPEEKFMLKEDPIMEQLLPDQITDSVEM